MNPNILSYALFFPLMTGIAVWTARICHRHGRIWMLRVFAGDTAFVDATNRVLLAGCYTVNIGYVALFLSVWPPITDATHLLALLATRIGIVLCTLALLHYVNISVLFIWSRTVRAGKPADHYPHTSKP